MTIGQRAGAALSVQSGAALCFIAVIASAARYAPIGNHVLLYWVIASPYLLLAAPTAVVILACGRHWLLAAFASIMTVAVLAFQAPAYVASAPPTDSINVRVMTANLRYGQANSAAITRLGITGADVVMLQELNLDAVRRLSDAGFDEAFPYRALDARDGAAGVGLYSRYPISASNKISGYELAMVSTRVRVSGVDRDVTLLSLHFAAPWPQAVDGWRNDIALFPATLNDLAAKAGDGAVVVAGDFNSTIDMYPFRRLLANGYSDAAEQSGGGRTLTYPANRDYPPLIGIDHVLVRNAVSVSTTTVEVPDTDHRALLTTIAIPKRSP